MFVATLSLSLSLQRQPHCVVIIQGDRVIAQSGSDYLNGQVESIEQQTCYEVTFEDESFCTNVPLSDITVLSHPSSSSSSSPSSDEGSSGEDKAGKRRAKGLAQGSNVRVRWSDGQLYSATIVGGHLSPFYQVCSCALEI